MGTLSRRAKRDLEALPGPLRDKADDLIGRLDSEPALGKKLLGKLSGLRSARLGRTHRIIYRLGDSGPEIVTISRRRDAYK